MISDSLYAKYIAEREGLSIVECEHGFLTYRINGDECFLADMYVEKGHRYRGIARDLIEALEGVAKGCKVITANIWTWDPHASQTMAASIRVGFKISSSRDGAIQIFKEIKED